MDVWENSAEKFHVNLVKFGSTPSQTNWVLYELRWKKLEDIQRFSTALASRTLITSKAAALAGP